METHLRTTGCRLPYGITQCYLAPNTSEHNPMEPVCMPVSLSVSHYISVCISICLSVCLRVVLDVAAFERVLGPCMDLMKRNIDAYEEQLVHIFGSKAAITDLRWTDLSPFLTVFPVSVKPRAVTPRSIPPSLPRPSIFLSVPKLSLLLSPSISPFIHHIFTPVLPQYLCQTPILSLSPPSVPSSYLLRFSQYFLVSPQIVALSLPQYLSHLDTTFSLLYSDSISLSDPHIVTRLCQRRSAAPSFTLWCPIMSVLTPTLSLSESPCPVVITDYPVWCWVRTELT